MGDPQSVHNILRPFGPYNPESVPTIRNRSLRSAIIFLYFFEGGQLFSLNFLFLPDEEIFLKIFFFYFFDGWLFIFNDFFFFFFLSKKIKKYCSSTSLRGGFLISSKFSSSSSQKIKGKKYSISTSLRVFLFSTQFSSSSCK